MVDGNGGLATDHSNDLFAAWQPREDAWRPLGPEHFHCPVNQQSLPIALPSDPDASIQLDKFETVAIVDLNAKDKQKTTGNNDVLLHAGGPIWAMDWCPVTTPASDTSTSTGASTSNTHQSAVLALGCHPHDAPLHQLGTTVTGPNSIQFWELPHTEGTRSTASKQLPQLSLILGHTGGLTWSIRWCPSRETAITGAPTVAGGLPRLGLIAAALGDGTVQVWPVLQPSSLRHLQSNLDGPLLAAPPSVALLSSRHLGGSLPCRVDWLPNAPHDLLLVACWDGTVAIAKLEPTLMSAATEGTGVPLPGSIGARPTGMRLLCHFQADTQPLRAAWWLPAGFGAGSIDHAHRYIFLTAGHEGTIKIWDARDQFNPQFAHQLTTATVLDATWATNPLGIMAALEEGSLRGLLLDSSSIREQLNPGSKPPMTFVWRGRNAGAQLAVVAHPKGDHVAYAGEDGIVGLARVELVWDNRKRKDHVPLLAMRVDHSGLRPVMRVAAPSELESAEDGNEGLYCKKVPVERVDAVKMAGGMVPDAAQILHKLAWGPLESSGAAWLAVGGAAGVVRCLKVPTPNIW